MGPDGSTERGFATTLSETSGVADHEGAVDISPEHVAGTTPGVEAEVSISDGAIARTLRAYLDRHPNEQGVLVQAVQLVAAEQGLASRRTFPLHVTAGALLLRGGTEILLIEHRAYGIWLQPGGHLEVEDDDLPAAALRELVEETGIDPADVVLASAQPVYVECGLVPARPTRGEPAHWHLDFGYLFTTGDHTDVGLLQDEEVTGAAWYPLGVAARLIGARVLRAVDPDAVIIAGASPRG
ncbi:MAG: hypothetical protein QG608_1120 [Actinomycetota bacterium]|nr:hypothetical protein [Actinomycetota bacterium]